MLPPMAAPPITTAWIILICRLGHHRPRWLVWLLGATTDVGGGVPVVLLVLVFALVLVVRVHVHVHWRGVVSALMLRLRTSRAMCGAVGMMLATVHRHHRMN